MDSRQRSGVERHPSAGGLGVGLRRGDRIRDDHPGAPILAAIAVLLVAAFIPVIYSFLHYKSLERRGEI